MKVATKLSNASANLCELYFYFIVIANQINGDEVGRSVSNCKSPQL